MPNNTMSEEELSHNESVKIIQAFCKIIGVHPEELEYGLPAPITEEKAHAMVAFVKQYTLSKQIEALLEAKKSIYENTFVFDTAPALGLIDAQLASMGWRPGQGRKQQEELK